MIILFFSACSNDMGNGRIIERERNHKSPINDKIVLAHKNRRSSYTLFS